MPLFCKRDRPPEAGRVLQLPVEALSPNPGQPRTQFDPAGLEELAASIREHGILQPLSVRRRGEGWELVAGERRLRAAKLAGLATVPCLAVEAGDAEASLLALVENLQRRDLDFWEEAAALSRLMDLYGLTQEEVAHRLGKSQSAIANKLRLLRLPEDVLALLREKGFTERHARALLRLPAPSLQREAARHITTQGLTVAATEAYVESLLSLPRKSEKKKPTYIIKDVRLFLNTVRRGLSMINAAGIGARCDRRETEDAILLTIQIPKRSA